MATQPLELRILTGFHAGGVVALPDAASLSVGSALDNDVILRDAPFRSASLEWQDGALVWRDQGGENRLSTQQLIRSGPLRLLVCAPSRSWDEATDSLPMLTVSGDAGDARAMPSEAGTEPGSDEAGLPPTGTEGGGDPTLEHGGEPGAPEAHADALPDDDPSRSPDTVTKPRPLRHARWAVPALAAAILLGLLLQVARNQDEPASPNAPAATESVQAPIDPAVLKAVTAHIKAAKLEPQVRASIVGHRIRLTGVVESDEEMEALLRRVATTTRQIDLDLLTLAELSLRAKEMAGSLAGDITASALAPGHIVLEGTVESTGERTQLLAMAQRLIPQAVSVQNRLLTRAEKALMAAGRTVRPLPALATPSAPAAPPPAPAPKLPPMTAVVSGESGYLILADGTRVLPGGMMRGVRLERIGETELIVSDPKGQRFRIAR